MRYQHSAINGKTNFRAMELLFQKRPIRCGAHNHFQGAAPETGNRFPDSGAHRKNWKKKANINTSR